MTIADEYMRDVRNNEALQEALEYAIADVEAGRELPIKEAFEKIDELREQKRKMR